MGGETVGLCIKCLIEDIRLQGFRHITQYSGFDKATACSEENTLDIYMEANTNPSVVPLKAACDAYVKF